MDVEHNGVGRQQIANRLRIACGFRHIRHRHVLEPRFDKLSLIADARGVRCGRSAQCRFFQTTARRHQAHAQFNQADVGFQMRHAVRAVHQGLATTAQCQTSHRSDHRHLCVFDAHRSVLEFFHKRFNRFCASLHKQRHRRLQIRACREWTARD